MVVVSRPYNGFDPGINLNIPKKLRELGILAIPMDFFPLDAPVDPENPGIITGVSDKRFWGRPMSCGRTRTFTASTSPISVADPTPLSFISFEIP